MGHTTVCSVLGVEKGCKTMRHIIRKLVFAWLNLLAGVIGVCTLGNYTPSWAIDYWTWSIRRQYMAERL